ncbi:MAG TPA: hypothetical protein VHZ07_14895 [Bryobacteraceae bacterium]|jgi:C-terminal processing protease CtpA/Prc|nr:hypothetical protein [Bryobacteraceae bacterium]
MHHPLHRRLSCLLIGLLVPFVLATRSFAQTAPGTDRLAAVGQLWVTVRYFHPYLAYRDIDWDQAFCNALSPIRQAKTPEEYAAALNRMLDVLHDPATRALVRANGTVTEPGAEILRFEQRPGGTLIVSTGRAEAPNIPGQNAQIKSLLTALEHASTVVFDLRASSFLSRLVDSPAVQSQLTATGLELPGQRTWVHNGLEPYRGDAGNAYYSAFLLKPGGHVSANAQTPDRHVAFLLGDGSRLPEIGAALWISGKAAVVSESPRALVGNPRTVSIQMGNGVAAMVRLSEALTVDGRALPEPILDSSSGSLDRAIASARNPPARQAGRLLPPFPVESLDKAYAEQPYPSIELRILAAAKIWGAFHYFFAYKDLMDEDWDQDFVEFLPRFEAAKNTRDYNLAVSEMLVRVDDSHATVSSAYLTSYFGEAPTPLRLRLIEKKPVVTRVLAEAKAAGIAPGDIVVDVDHSDTVERANVQAKYISASTRAWLGDRVMQRLLNGPEGSIATLTIKTPGGQEKQVQLKRSKAYASELEIEREGDAVRLLPGGIGYADLNRLTRDEVDSTLEKFHDAKFIIFDMRGRAATGAEDIAGRLAREEGMAGVIVNGPLALQPDLPTRERLTQTSSYFFVEALPASTKPGYSGKTVMLIDERTVGDAERTGLFFESANKTSFVGSPSAGAISDETNFVIPGGIIIGLSGRDVRHGNSGQLQRLGIQPTVAVTPTIDGILHGKDEVLEKAIEYVSAQ